MKKVTITKMHLLNFKGIRDLDITFTGETTNIEGRNGSGKTTVFDAFTWVLFGKDSKDRKQFDIKTLDIFGQPIPKIPHEVSVTLDIDGEQINLTRRYTEKWTKRRGSAKEEFTGHEEERLYNDVPCSVKEWSEKIEAICPEQVFKLITNPEYFAAQRWEQQRAILIRMAGEVSDADITKGNKDFTALLDQMAGKTIEEYKREIGAKKKRIRENLETIPGRIDERSRDIREDINAAAIRKELKEKEQAVADIDSKLADLSKDLQAAGEKRQKLIDRKLEVSLAVASAEERIRRETEKQYREARSSREQMQARLRDITEEKTRLAKSATDREAELADMEQRRASLIAEYREIEADTLQFSEFDFLCPTCLRPLEPQDIERKQAEMLERFNAAKAARLEANKAEGRKVGRDIITAKREEIEKIKAQADTLAAAADDLIMQLQETPEPTRPDATPAIEADPEWQRLNRERQKLDKEISDPISTTDRGELAEAKNQLQQSIYTLRDTLAIDARNADNRRRIAELEKEHRALAEELAALEGIEFTMAAFTKAKIEAVEKKINSLFELVTFRMYETQINGGEVEKCEAIIYGVPYSSANNAGRINAGLDIISAICKAEGISAPIFIDNAESIIDILPTESQQIHLTVADTPLTIIH